MICEWYEGFLSSWVTLVIRDYDSNGSLVNRESLKAHSKCCHRTVCNVFYFLASRRRRKTSLFCFKQLQINIEDFQFNHFRQDFHSRIFSPDPGWLRQFQSFSGSVEAFWIPLLNRDNSLMRQRVTYLEGKYFMRDHFLFVMMKIMMMIWGQRRWRQWYTFKTLTMTTKLITSIWFSILTTEHALLSLYHIL